jgi:hypothetical protein
MAHLWTATAIRQGSVALAAWAVATTGYPIGAVRLAREAQLEHGRATSGPLAERPQSDSPPGVLTDSS